MPDTTRPNLTAILRHPLSAVDGRLLDMVGREAADRIEQLETEVENLREQAAADHGLIVALGKTLAWFVGEHPCCGGAKDSPALIYMAEHHRQRYEWGAHV